MPDAAFPTIPSGPPVPPEPVALRDRLRAEAEADPAQARLTLSDGAWITEWLWTAWAPELERTGIGQDQVRREAGRWSRETWLWIMGERQWGELSALVYGGLLRRAGDRGRPGKEADTVGGGHSSPVG